MEKDWNERYLPTGGDLGDLWEGGSNRATLGNGAPKSGNPSLAQVKRFA